MDKAAPFGNAGSGSPRTRGGAAAGPGAARRSGVGGGGKTGVHGGAALGVGKRLYSALIYLVSSA